MNTPPRARAIMVFYRPLEAGEVTAATEGRQSMRRMAGQRSLARSLGLSISKQRYENSLKIKTWEGGHAAQYNTGCLVVDRPRGDCRAGNRGRRDAAAARERKERAAQLAHDPSRLRQFAPLRAQGDQSRHRQKS